MSAPASLSYREVEMGEEWIGIIEAAALLGLSERQVRRMADQKVFPSRRRSGRRQVLCSAVKALAAQRNGSGAEAVASASPVLLAKRERIQELLLEAEELRAKREIKKLHEEDAEPQRHRREKEQELAITRQHLTLEATRDAEQREREEQQVAIDKWRASCARRAMAQAPAWLNMQQRESLLSTLRGFIADFDLEHDDEVTDLLAAEIRRICIPWQKEREVLASRERLVERAISWQLSSYATESEKVQAAKKLRTDLSLLPLTASNGEANSVIVAGLEPFQQAIKQRFDKENAEREAKAAEERKRREKEQAESEAKAAEERKRREKEQAESEAKAAEERKRRQCEYHRDALVSHAVSHVPSHLAKLLVEHEISRDEFFDRDFQNYLEKAVRQEAMDEFKGQDAETFADAEELCEQVMYEELDDDPEEPECDDDT